MVQFMDFCKKLMKRLNYLTIESTTKFCPLISGEDSPDNVNRSTDVLLTGDMAEDVESLLTSVSLEALKDSIRPALTVNTYYGSNLRLRSASGSIIGRMADNETVTFAGDIRITRDANGQVPIGDTDNPPDGSVENPHVWFKVTTSGGQTGWASAEYLEGTFEEIEDPVEEPEPDPEPLGPTFRLDPDPEPGPTFRLDPEPNKGPDFRGDPGPDEEPDFKANFSLDINQNYQNMLST